ncbi:MAG: serine/threonine protein kinase [Deltaproteobacteria bacterium]|nr:serine/threonine protein kinase [Deltaproteobacteria bacterium]
MADATELIGRIFDSRYQITEQIGRGGMGAVYKAIHVSMNQVVALKVLGREMSRDDKQVQRFYHEARTSSRLKHPNTIKVFDFGRAEEGHLYLAMEFLEGLTLTQLIRQEKVLSVRRAAKVAKQVTKSLAEAHMNGLVHRDLKPDNVFITHIYGENDFVKVLDFGIAKFLEGNPEHERLTQAGLVCGTPLYISPEQALGRSLDGRSDLYSLGVMIYEMVSGSPPFKADTPVALVMRHIHDEPPQMADHNPSIHLPRSLYDLIYRLLNKDRDKRPSSAEELIQAMDAVMADPSLPPEPVEAPPPPPPLAGGKRGGITRVETPAGEFLAASPDDDSGDETQALPQAAEEPAPDEVATAFLPQGSKATGSHPLGGDEDFGEETIVLPSAPDDNAPIQVPASPQPTRQVEAPITTTAPATKPSVWPWLLVALGSLALGGGMATYGLGLFDSKPAAMESEPVVVKVPVTPPVKKPAPTPAQVVVAPTPKPVQLAAAPKPRSLDIALETVPTGATIEIDGRPSGTTPIYLTMLAGGRAKTLVFKAEGYRNTTVILEPTAIVRSGKDRYRYILDEAQKPQPKIKPKKKAKPRSKPKPKPKPVLNWE